MTLVGIEADEQTVGDVLPGSSGCEGRWLRFEDVAPGDAELPADEYTFDQEVTV